MISRQIGEAWARGLRPEPPLLVSQWADAHRVLSPRASNEPGPWRTSRTPYLKEIMDCLSPRHPAQRVVLMAGAQIGKSEAGANWIGYVIHHAPGPMLAVQPTVELAKRFSQQRIAPLIEESAVLRDRVSPARSRDSSNTVMSKEFPGGILVLTGANSAVGLRSMPVRYLFLDEVDAYPDSADDEGDPVALADARTRTFSWRRKVFLTSTPTIKGASRIEREYEASDQRRYFVPCPHCGHFQFLIFDRLRWEKGRPETAVYMCEACEAPISEHNKTAMLAKGEWRATAESSDPTTVGFHLSSLYSPVGWLSWERIAREWIAGHKRDEMRRSFVNTVLGETWEEKGEAPDVDRLMLRREDYPLRRMPDDAIILTAGVDVQKDYLQYEVVAWGYGRTSWSVDFGVIEGDTAANQVWDRLDALLAAPIVGSDGRSWQIEMAAVDSGHNTQHVYWFARSRPKVMAVKGSVDALAPALGAASAQEVDWRGKRIKRGVMLWPVGTWSLKAELFANLRRDPDDSGAYPDGYCHFSTAHDRPWFEQLTAEKLVTRVVKGRTKREWVQEGKNEALDCRVYATAAAIHLGLWTLDSSGWARLARARGVGAVQRAVENNLTEHAQHRIKKRPAAYADDWLRVPDGWL